MSKEDITSLCNFFFSTCALIFLIAHGFYIFEMATGPSSSLVIVKKLKLTLYRTGQAFRVPRKLRLPQVPNNQHMKWGRLSALCAGHIYPEEISWHSFLLEAEWTPGS
jgi:hypothetical protein